MPLPDPDAKIADLYGLLLDRLSKKLRREAPPAVEWFERLGNGAQEYHQRHPDVWPRTLGSFDAPERTILSGLFDVRVGLDSVRSMSEQSLAATDLHQFHMAAVVMPILISALLERLEHLAKRSRRSGTIGEAVEQRMLGTVAKYRERDRFLTGRDASAHGSFTSDDSWLRTPERERLWEAVALGPTPREPLTSMYHGPVNPKLHSHTRKRLVNVESMTSYTLALLLDGLRES